MSPRSIFLPILKEYLDAPFDVTIPHGSTTKRVSVSEMVRWSDDKRSVLVNLNGDKVNEILEAITEENKRRAAAAGHNALKGKERGLRQCNRDSLIKMLEQYGFVKNPGLAVVDTADGQTWDTFRHPRFYSGSPYDPESKAHFPRKLESHRVREKDKKRRQLLQSRGAREAAAHARLAAMCASVPARRQGSQQRSGDVPARGKCSDQSTGAKANSALDQPAGVRLDTASVNASRMRDARSDPGAFVRLHAMMTRQRSAGIGTGVARAALAFDNGHTPQSVGLPHGTPQIAVSVDEDESAITAGDSTAVNSFAAATYLSSAACAQIQTPTVRATDAFAGRFSEPQRYLLTHAHDSGGEVMATPSPLATLGQWFPLQSQQAFAEDGRVALRVDSPSLNTYLQSAPAVASTSMPSVEGDTFSGERALLEHASLVHAGAPGYSSTFADGGAAAAYARMLSAPATTIGTSPVISRRRSSSNTTISTYDSERQLGAAFGDSTCANGEQRALAVPVSNGAKEGVHHPSAGHALDATMAAVGETGGGMPFVHASRAHTPSAHWLAHPDMQAAAAAVTDAVPQMHVPQTAGSCLPSPRRHAHGFRILEGVNVAQFPLERVTSYADIYRYVDEVSGMSEEASQSEKSMSRRLPALAEPSTNVRLKNTPSLTFEGLPGAFSSQTTPRGTWQTSIESLYATVPSTPDYQAPVSVESAALHIAGIEPAGPACVPVDSYQFVAGDTSAAPHVPGVHSNHAPQ